MGGSVIRDILPQIMHMIEYGLEQILIIEKGTLSYFSQSERRIHSVPFSLLFHFYLNFPPK